MRIRKRFLSLSAAVTAPPSLDLSGDVHHRPLLLVQPPQLHPNGNLRLLYDNSKSQPSDLPQPPSSDHSTQIGIRPSTWVSSGAVSDPTDAIVSPQKNLELKESAKKKEEIIKHDYSCRKESILSAQASSNHNLVLKGWLEGDRLMIPIKKRRGSFGKRVNNNEMTQKNYERCVATIQDVSASSSPKKNGKKRGNVIMEGSRCSRVNGRGWRCWQQTLVGYSLCEHHLGKGRLRSMTTIRGRAQKIAQKRKDKESHDDDYDYEIKEWQEDSLSCVEDMKKKKKHGVVKARSLTSLLSPISS